MYKEFEGKNEQEAIDKALYELDLNSDQIDFEIVESVKKSIFRKGSVKIKVFVEDEEDYENIDPVLMDDVTQFTLSLLDKMGFPSRVKCTQTGEMKLLIKIESEHSNIIIGKKGKNLDALQLIVNVYAGRKNQKLRVIIDAENYRIRREQNLVRMAKKIAHSVRKAKGSKLLEPMNPFERRLIHTALSNMEHIRTVSEGEGIIKQIRIYYSE
ncbi:MAG: protein jag [Spirochaetales bacterium]|nr:protein jag [Spirochaetales bacterium]